MSILADYRVLGDGKITPSLAIAGAVHDYSVLLPTNFLQATEHLPLISFRLDTGLPTGLTFRIRTSNTLFATFVTAFTATYNSDVFHSVHEVINLNSLQGGVANTIRFERVSGTGTLDISDVILWYKRNVTAANLSIPT